MDDKYSCFSKLAANERYGEDYEICVRPQIASQVAIIAPHGGKIEPKTSEIAAGIAGAEFSLYCFQGVKNERNYRDLHITSTNFNEPQCLELIAKHDWVLAIHGSKKKGERAFLGGLDKPFIDKLASALRAANITAETTGHPYLGEKQNNICNRGAQSVGTQIELTWRFRQSNRVPLFIQVVRRVLVSLR